MASALKQGRPGPLGPAFLGGAALLAWAGAALPAWIGWLPWWAAVSTAIAGICALSGWTGPYGKRPDGTRAAWSKLLMLPFVLPLHTWWHLRRPMPGEAPWQDLGPDLSIGRRLLAQEFTIDVDHVVDLTCEYEEPGVVRRHPGYLNLPIVDGGSPAPAMLSAYVEAIGALDGHVLIHCAEGHGRTSLVAAALLLAGGHAKTADEAFAAVRARRPSARPYAVQRRALERFAGES